MSIAGNRLALLAIPWFVLETTGRPEQAGLSGFAYFLPIALSGLLGGAVVDRFGFIRVSVVADVASAVSIAAIPILYAANMLPFWALLVLIFTGSLLDVPATTARRALLPDVAKASGISLERVMSAHETGIRLAQLLGASAGGALIVAFGAVAVLYFDAATFLVSAALMGLVARTALRGSRPNNRGLQQGAGRGMLHGLQYIKSDAVLPGILLTFTVANMLDNALFAIVLPAVVQEQYESAYVLGFAIAAFGAGALIGAIVYGAVGHRLSKRWLLFGCLVIAGPTKFVVLVTSASAPWIIVVLFLAGVAAGPVNPLLTTVQFRRIPPDLRGRVLGAMMSVVIGAVPIGVLLAGAAISALGLATVLLACALCYLAISLLPLILASWGRYLDAPEQHPQSS